MSDWNKTIQDILAEPEPKPVAPPMTPDETRERLARIGCNTFWADQPVTQRIADSHMQEWLEIIDAILAEQAAIEREKAMVPPGQFESKETV